MGFSLANAHGQHLALNWINWRRLLMLASVHGWRGRGTLPNHEMILHQLAGTGLSAEALEAEVERVAAEWPGHYFSNDFQIVDAADAGAMADALERAIPHMPPAESAGDAEGCTIRCETLEQAMAGVSAALEKPLDPDLVRAGVAFFRGGAFQIW